MLRISGTQSSFRRSSLTLIRSFHLEVIDKKHPAFNESWAPITVLPGSVHHFQKGRSSRLTPYTEDVDWFQHDIVEVAADGLVYPGLSQDKRVCNGAKFRGHVQWMREYMCDFFEGGTSCSKDNRGKKFVVTIPQGTVIPSTLQMLHRITGVGYMPASTFFLGPPQPMPLNDLNQLLTEFYKAHAETIKIGKWFDAHPYRDIGEEGDPDTWG